MYECGNHDARDPVLFQQSGTAKNAKARRGRKDKDKDKRPKKKDAAIGRAV